MHTAKVTPRTASALSPEAHRLLDLLEDGFVFLDSGLRITDLNAAAEPLIGLPRADVLGKESVNILPEPVGAADDAGWRQQLQQRGRVEFDCRSQRSDRWLRARAYRAPDGGVCIQYRDITDERRVHFELASREAELATIADALPALISYIDKDGRYRFVNRQYEEWFGHSRKDILGRHMSDVLGEKVFAALQPNILRVLAGEHLSFETFAPYRDGGSRHIRASYEPRYFENEVVGFFALVTDISQRKRAELLLADQNRVLEALASATHLEIILEALCEALERQLNDSAIVTILVADESGSFLTVAAGNKCPEEFRSALGKIPVLPGAGSCGTAAYTRQPVVSTDIESDPDWAAYRAPAARCGLKSCWSVPMIASTSDVLGTVAVYYRSPRTPTAHELEVMSLLARTAALAVQSRRAEKAFRDFANTAPSMLWVTAPNGECTFLSRGWYDFTGQTEADAAGFAWLDAVHPDDRAQARARFRIAIDQQTTFALEHRVRRADGEYRWVIDAGRPRFSPHGTFLGHIGSVIDITERKAIEDKLREGDRRKDEFLATLAHELRNPLAPIRNGLEVMKRIPTENRVIRQTRDMMDRQLSHMVRLIDDLLDVSRITRGMVELRRQLVSVKTVVDIALEATQAQIQGNAQQLTVKLPPEPLTLEADPARLAQVISNLLNNAIKYTPPGGEIELSVSREADEAVISVRDTGIGIPEDMLEQVFDLFTQVSRDQQRAQGGLGIGLALVRQLVQMHGGRVHAESRGPDQGSTFVVKLPLPAKPSATEGASAVVQTATGKPHRILVVDDNQDAADSLAMLLQQAGHLTRTVYNGEDALTASREFQPRVVCLDIGLPDTSGYEVAKILRREASASDLTLVALTGWGAEEDRAKARAAGFDVHLTKPVDVNLLERLLASVP